MAKENTAAENGSNKTVSAAAPDNALKDRRRVLMGKWIETTVAILLGFVDRFTAQRHSVHQLYQEQQHGFGGNRGI